MGDWKDVAKDLVAGSVSGGVGLVVGHPLDVIKTRMQNCRTGRETVSHVLVTTLRNEGIPGLFKGIVAPLVGQIAYSSLTFAGFNFCLTKICGDDIAHAEEASMTHLFVAGCGGGALSTLATTPCELIKVNLQDDRKARGFGELRRFLNERRQSPRGLLSLYSGWSATFVRDCPTSGLYFLIYYGCKDYFANKGTGSVMAELLSGGIAGSLTWGSVLHVDVIKTRFQIDACKKEPVYSGVMDCVKKTFRDEGLRGFTKGAFPLIVRAFPVNAVNFFVYERMKELLYE